MTRGRAPSSVAGLILAAGRSSRFAGGDKLARPFRGRPLVCWPVEAALAAGLDPVVVVLGCGSERLRPLIAGRPLTLVDNARHASGLTSSLRAGLEALPAGCAGTVVLLADMPLVGAGHIARLAAAFEAGDRRPVVVPTAAGRPGNPVLWPASLFPALARLVGDTGGRALLAAGHCRDEAGMPVPVVQVAMADDAVLVDVDDADALARLEAAARAGR